jgi:hypothetical protein
MSTSRETPCVYIDIYDISNLRINIAVLDGSHYVPPSPFKSSSLAVGRRKSADKREVLLIAGANNYSGVGVISLLSKVNGRQTRCFIYRPEQTCDAFQYEQICSQYSDSHR